MVLGIFEDHPIVAQSLVQVFESSGLFDTVYHATTGNAFLAQLEAHPDTTAVILDFIAEDVTGTELFDKVYRTHPYIAIVAFTSLSSPILIENLLAAGARGYVHKNQPVPELLEAVRVTINGAYYLPEDFRFILKRLDQVRKIVLSPRELEILQLIQQEYTANDIARQLNLSVNTIETHKRRLLDRFQVNNTAGLIREGMRLGYIQ